MDVAFFPFWRCAPIIFIFFCYALSPSSVIASIVEQCPSEAADPLYREAIEYYAYRLAPQVKTHGCGVISVYAAFGHGHHIIIEQAEEDPTLRSARRAWPCIFEAEWQKEARAAMGNFFGGRKKILKLVSVLIGATPV